MRKKLLCSLALVIALTALLTVPALAAGEERVALGADLTDKQKATVYEFFGVEPGTVEELTVTIDEERAYLGAHVPAEKIGSRSLSSIYIRAAEEGAGITVSTHNINWVTAEMYIAALTTAGVKDASVVVAAPVSVSGTAALTGIFKAYEAIAGEELDSLAKDTATEELVTTGELAEYLGSDEATQLMNELKKALAELENKSPEEIRQIVLRVAEQLDIQLTDEQVDQLVNWLLKLAKMNIDPEKLLEQARSIQEKLDALAELQAKTEGFFARIASLWSSFVNWLKGIFG